MATGWIGPRVALPEDEELGEVEDGTDDPQSADLFECLDAGVGICGHPEAQGHAKRDR